MAVAKLRNNAAASATIYGAVRDIFAESDGNEIDNKTLYRNVAERVGISQDEFDLRQPVGRTKTRHSLHARTARFSQQTLRLRGHISRVDGKRGVWKLTTVGRQQLHRIDRKFAMIAFSTKLGIAVWSDAGSLLDELEEKITLLVTSPPYPIAKGRAYGGITPGEYTDFMLAVIERALPKLRRGGVVCLNLTQDVFLPNLPARSTYRERLVIALEDKLGLYLVDTAVWSNPSKAPGPILYSSINRYMLGSGWEPILLLTNDPKSLVANNKRVLLPHTERHQRLMARGGEQRIGEFADGAYRIRPGSFANVTPGRIPKNVLTFGHSCASQRRAKAMARALGLPAHGAPFPASLVRFLIQYLSEKGDLVVDPFGGSLTVAEVCEELERRYAVGDIHLEYIRGGAERVRGAAGFRLNPDVDRILGLQPLDAIQQEFILV